MLDVSTCIITCREILAWAEPYQLKLRHLRVLFCIRFSARRVAPKSLISYFCRWISSMVVFTWKDCKYMYLFMYKVTEL